MFASQRRVALCITLLLAAACNKHTGPGTGAPRAGAGRPDQPLFRGMCDASGAVALGERRFAVADDEDNLLRVYDAERAGAPLYALDVSAALGLLRKKHTPEADIEAGTRLGPYALWLTSHGLNSHGKRQSSRFRFFATSAPDRDQPIEVLGQPYASLLDDLLETPELAWLDLASAASLPPKAPGGLNIEGLGARLDGSSVWIGFRNPLRQGRALLVPLLNPLAVVHGDHAQFGAAVLLPLGGLGVRALGLWHGQYLIAAGAAAADNGNDARLFLWDGAGAPRQLEADLHDFTPEAFVSVGERSQLLLLSDDGSRSIDGSTTRCKDLTDPERKGFRGRWVELHEPN